MPAADPTSTLGDIVREQPRAAALFERLGLDYCCGGRLRLEEACGQRGLHAMTVATLLHALADEPADRGLDVHDVARASIPELCDHIVIRHHELLRRELPRINDVLDTVVRVHATPHPELHDLQRVFAGVRSDLEAHMHTEEQTLFPACRALDGDGAFDSGLLELLEHDHAATGDALCALRELAGGYDTQAAPCGTHRSLLRALRDFELDMHQHVHEENNVLFPRVRARIAGWGESGGPARDVVDMVHRGMTEGRLDVFGPAVGLAVSAPRDPDSAGCIELAGHQPA